MKYLIVFIFLLTACMTTKPSSLKSHPIKAKSCNIDILFKKPKKKFKKLTLLSARVNFKDGSLDKNTKSLSELKKKACLAGGDALLISPYKKKKAKKGSTIIYFNPLTGLTSVSPSLTGPVPSTAVPIQIKSDLVNLNLAVIKYLK